jgi:hypothetical protein
MTVDLPDPWSRIVDENLRAKWEAELKKELGPAHCLANVPFNIIAKRDDRDDVLAVLDGGQVAQIHMTWSGRPEADPRWPASPIYESMTDWLTACDSL